MEKTIAAGVWPVMLVPFHEDHSLDWEGLDTLTDWYIENGVAGLFAVCLSSEMYKLSAEERLRVATRVVAHAAGRVPVVAAGAFGDSIAAQSEAVRRIVDTGVSSVVLTVNQLAAAPDDDALWQRNAEAIFNACEGVPLGLYECPAPYKRTLTPELLQWVARSGRVRFFKDTCCRRAEIKKKLEAIRGTSLVWFNAHAPSLLESLRLGGHGYSGIAANVYPDLLVWLCAQFEKQPEKAKHLQRFLTLADMTIRNRYPASAKCWLRTQGLPIGETCRVPVGIAPPNDDESLVFENLREMLRSIKEMHK